MAAYRFCRTDDIPLLVEAYNAFCLDSPVPRRPLTVDGYKRMVRELDLWASSCMLASEGRDPIGVLFATKRPDETLIHAVGIHPEHRRRGHGGHLLTSLSQKLAILGPPRLVAEVPADRPDLIAFVESCGYAAEAEYRDMVLPSAAPAPAAADGLVVPATLDEILSDGTLLAPGQRAWERTLPTLTARKDRLRGLAVASDLRLEAFLLHWRPEPDRATEIVALGHAPDGQAGSPDGQGQALLGVAIRHLAGLEHGPVELPRVGPDEVDLAWLEGLGFRTTRRWRRLAATAVPG